MTDILNSKIRFIAQILDNPDYLVMFSDSDNNNREIVGKIALKKEPGLKFKIFLYDPNTKYLLVMAGTEKEIEILLDSCLTYYKLSNMKTVLEEEISRLETENIRLKTENEEMLKKLDNLK